MGPRTASARAAVWKMGLYFCWSCGGGCCWEEEGWEVGVGCWFWGGGVSEDVILVVFLFGWWLSGPW